MEISNNIILIIVFILFAFLLFKINELQKKLSLETFNNSEYLADVQAIRTLSVIADGLQKDGYTVPGNLTIAGNGRVNGTSYVGDNLVLSGSNTWNLHTPNDGRKTLFFGKGANDNVDTYPIWFDEDGTINCSRIKVGSIECSNLLTAGTLISNGDANIKGTCLLGNTNIRGTATIDTSCTVVNTLSVGAALTVGSTIVAKNHITTEADMRCGNMYGKRWIPW